MGVATMRVAVASLVPEPESLLVASDARRALRASRITAVVGGRVQVFWPVALL